jgi:protein-export membrane protein SecD
MKKAKKNDLFKLLLIIAIMGVALFSLYPLGESINLGLDLQGGSQLVLEVKIPEGTSPEKAQDDIDRIITILRNRVDQYGLVGPVISRMGKNRVLVKLPGAEDPEQARMLIGRTALLEFRKVLRVGRPKEEIIPESPLQEVLFDLDGVPYLVEIDPLLTGGALEDAKVMTSRPQFGPIETFVDLTFTEEGAKGFSRAILEVGPEEEGGRLAIVLDGVIQSAPVVKRGLYDDALGGKPIKNAQITGGFTPQEARALAIVLRAGALPAEVEIIQEDSIGPTLGEDSIRRGVITIVTGFILILLYMPLRYQLLGLVADFALLLNMLIMFGALALFGATLTLPGIAGIILTIGMTVDANVIIFERIKEERFSGKSPMASMRGGFQKSLSTLLDANITTLAVAGIMLFLGTGPIKGFAITLGIGIMGSLFCALFVTRFILEATGLSPVKAAART